MMYTIPPMQKLIALTCLVLFLLPAEALAYRVPERDYWRLLILQFIKGLT